MIGHYTPKKGGFGVKNLMLLFMASNANITATVLMSHNCPNVKLQLQNLSQQPHLYINNKNFGMMQNSFKSRHLKKKQGKLNQKF